ncbi:MAG: phosphotransferase [Alphaproteobacteria bacterium]|nr:phosphotransferase [Alphaproteobacteria bacterium]MCD8563179.1 phosphotransferase [Alphaproteobacteria bacterium]
MKHADFITFHGWHIIEALPQDGSARSYIRLEKNGKTALLMDCGPLSGISYITRLTDFIRIGGWLRDINLRAPEIYEADEAANIAIIEDFGGTSLKAAMAQGHDKKDLYTKAAAILKRFEDTPCPLALNSFWESPMRRARQRLVDWYIPAVRGEANPAGLRESYLGIWDDIEKQLPAPAEGFMHVDFHVENLMLLPGGDIGIIDFQEALSGPPAYDLGNLLEDMRADVPDDIQTTLLHGRDEGFMGWYRVLTTQFHMRLLGQCIRWAVHDNKPQYMKFMPRLENYVISALESPVLAPLKSWCREEGLDFSPLQGFNPDKIRPLIAEDAV